MKALIVLLAVILTISALPYARCLIKRIILAIKLTAVCKRCGYKLRRAHPLWFLGSKHGAEYDLYIEKGRYLFAVKLFGTQRYTSELVFTSEGNYFVRNFIAVFAAGGAVRMPVESKTRKMKHYSLSRRKIPSLQVKIIRRVLIVNPVCYQLKYREKNGAERIVDSGESVNGNEIYSLSRFADELERIHDRTYTY